jgi:hypothetical protein
MDLGDFMKKLLTLTTASMLVACSSVEPAKPIDNYSIVFSNNAISVGQDYLSFYNDNLANGKANIYSKDAITLSYDNLRRKFFDEYELSRHHAISELVNQLAEAKLSEGLSLPVEMMRSLVQGFMPIKHSREVGKDFSRIYKASDKGFSETLNKDIDFSSFALDTSMCKLTTEAERVYRVINFVSNMSLEQIAELTLASPELVDRLNLEVVDAYTKSATKTCFEHQIVLGQVDLLSTKGEMLKVANTKQFVMESEARGKNGAVQKGLILISDQPVSLEADSAMYQSYLQSLKSMQSVFVSKSVEDAIPVFKTLLETSTTLESGDKLTSKQKQELNKVSSQLKSLLGEYANPYLSVNVDIMSNDGVKARQYNLLNVFSTTNVEVGGVNYSGVSNCVRSGETVLAAMRNDKTGSLCE